MTVATTTNQIIYAGNGVTTAFSFPYVFFAKADLVVTLFITSTNLSATPAPVLNGSATYDYAITGTVTTGEYASGGTVTFNTAPPAGYNVVIVRSVAATQDVALVDNSKFPSTTVNVEFDKLTVLTQQAIAGTDRALHLPASDPVGTSTVIPPVATRASTYLGFDSSGVPTALAAPTATTAVSAAMAPVIIAATLAAARTAMGVSGVADNNSFSGTNAFASTTTAPTQAAADSSTKVATTAFVRGEFTALATADATTFLAGDVALNNTGTFFDGPNTGSIGAAGQKWLIMATGNFIDGAGSAAMELAIFNGSVYIADDVSHTGAANLRTTITIMAVVTLAAATTFTLRGKDLTSTSGTLVTTGAATGVVNKATSITAVRLV